MELGRIGPRRGAGAAVPIGFAQGAGEIGQDDGQSDNAGGKRGDQHPDEAHTLRAPGLFLADVDAFLRVWRRVTHRSPPQMAPVKATATGIGTSALNALTLTLMARAAGGSRLFGHPVAALSAKPRQERGVVLP